jgi:hypothetical protein
MMGIIEGSYLLLAVAAKHAKHGMLAPKPETDVMHFALDHTATTALDAAVHVLSPQPMTDTRALSGATRAQFSNGLVATGVISKAAADTTYSCTVEVMGLGGTGSGCACTPAATCTVDSSCFGDLCLYSRYAVLPQTTYTVGVGGNHCSINLAGHALGDVPVVS